MYLIYDMINILNYSIIIQSDRLQLLLSNYFIKSFTGALFLLRYRLHQNKNIQI